MEIKLTQEEIAVIEKYLKGEIQPFYAKGNERTCLSSVIHKAEQFAEENNAWDEIDDDTIDWFYNKYKNQK